MDEEIVAKDEAVKPEVVDEVTETPQESPTEQKTETTEAPVEGENTQPQENVPFHKHPRWQKLTQHNKELEATVNELMTFKQQMESQGQSIPSGTIPEWFKNAYGDNPEVWKLYSGYDKEMRDGMKAEILKEIKAEQEKQTQEVTKWNEWVENQFDELEDTGKTFDRNAFRKFILDYNQEYKALPLTEKGDIDISKCYDLMTKLNPPPIADTTKVEEKKKLAGKQSATSTTPATDGAIALSDLRGKRDWRDF